MRSTYREAQRNSMIVSGIALTLLLVVFGAFLKATVGVYQKERLARAQRELIEERVYTLEERRATLSRDLERLETERGVEEEIREKFRVVKEGEQLLILVDENQTANARNVRPIENRGWFARLLDWF